MDTFISLHGKERDTPPNVPDTGYRDFYPKSDGWYEMGHDGVERKLSNYIPGASDSINYRGILTGANGSVTANTSLYTDTGTVLIFTLARSGEGVYTLTRTNAFALGATAIQITLGSATGGLITKAVRTSNDVITITTFDVDGTTASDFIGTLNITIIVDTD